MLIDNGTRVVLVVLWQSGKNHCHLHEQSFKNLVIQCVFLVVIHLAYCSYRVRSGRAAPVAADPCSSGPPTSAPASGRPFLRAAVSGNRRPCRTSWPDPRGSAIERFLSCSKASEWSRTECCGSKFDINTGTYRVCFFLVIE